MAQEFVNSGEAGSVGPVDPIKAVELIESVDRTRALYERPVLAPQDETTFSDVKAAVESHFASERVQNFLRSLDRAGLRIRHFEEVLTAGKLGSATAAQYAKLPASDQGQVRECYLASLEQVAMPLRDKFFKLYAYY